MAEAVYEKDGIESNQVSVEFSTEVVCGDVPSLVNAASNGTQASFGIQQPTDPKQCKLISYTVNAASTNGSGVVNQNVPATGPLVASLNLTPGTTYNMSVIGTCLDGKSTAKGVFGVFTMPNLVPNYPPPNPPPRQSPPPPTTCSAGQYNNGGACANCPLPSGCQSSSCTSAATSSCTQCAAGYLSDGVGCKTDPCASGIAGANTQSGNIGFGSFVSFTNSTGGTIFQPGTYEVRYVDGCMKYGGGQLWTVNAQYPDYGWYIGVGASNKLSQAPGAVGYSSCGNNQTPGQGCGFQIFADCVAYSQNIVNVPPKEVTLASSSTLGVWIQDGANGGNQYGDNVAGEGGKNPSWLVKLKNCSTRVGGI